WQIFFSIFIIRAALQPGIVYTFNLWMLLQPFCQGKCILHMTVHTQGERFQSINKKERVERADCRTKIAQAFNTCLNDKTYVAEGAVEIKYVPKLQTMIPLRWLSKS